MIITIDQLECQFPLEPYESQIIYMQHLVSSLKQKKLVLLQFPTGIGKSLAYISVIISFTLKVKTISQILQQNLQNGGLLQISLLKEDDIYFMQSTYLFKEFIFQSDFIKVPNINLYQLQFIIATYTVAQVQQISDALLNFNIGPLNVSFLVSRKHYCFQDFQSTTISNDIEDNIDNYCHQLNAKNLCSYNSQDKISQACNTFQQRNIKQSIQYCYQKQICPYYLQKEYISYADIVISTYSYIFDPFINPFKEKRIQFLLIDEAHLLSNYMISLFSIKFELQIFHTLIEQIKNRQNIIIQLTKDQQDYIKLFFQNLWYIIRKLTDIQPFQQNMFDICQLQVSNISQLQMISHHQVFNQCNLDSQSLNKAQKLIYILCFDNNILHNFRLYLNNSVFNLFPVSSYYINPKQFQEIDNIIFTSALFGSIEIMQQDYPMSLQNFVQYEQTSQNQTNYYILTKFNNTDLLGNFKNSLTSSYQRLITLSIFSIIKQAAQYGIIIYFKSYKQLDSMKQYMKFIQTKIEFSLFIDDQKISTQTLLDNFNNTVNHKKAVLLTIHYGRLADGMNFIDNRCRILILVSIPYLPKQSPEVIERIQYLQNQGEAWYLQKTIQQIVQICGRSTRHINDFSDIILLDSRYKDLEKQLQLHFSRKISSFPVENYKANLMNEKSQHFFSSNLILSTKNQLKQKLSLFRSLNLSDNQRFAFLNLWNINIQQIHQQLLQETWIISKDLFTENQQKILKLLFNKRIK